MPRETQSSYGAVAKSFHWTIVLLVAIQFVIAFSMPDIEPGVVPDALINLHLSFGVSVFLIIMLRLLWRFRPPPASATWRAMFIRCCLGSCSR